MTERVTPFLKKMRNMKENVNIIFCNYAGKNKVFKENYANIFEEINLEFISTGTSKRNGVI